MIDLKSLILLWDSSKIVKFYNPFKLMLLRILWFTITTFALGIIPSIYK
jgi:hypothetical protein